MDLASEGVRQCSLPLTLGGNGRTSGDVVSLNIVLVCRSGRRCLTAFRRCFFTWAEKTHEYICCQRAAF